MGFLDKASSRSKSVVAGARDRASKARASGGGVGGLASPGPYDIFNRWQEDSKTSAKYAQFTGYLYQAINAIAKAAATQPVKVGMLPSEGGKPGSKKSVRLMTRSAKALADADGIDILDSHPLLKTLEKPNAVQGRWQFTYSFVANLCLTGWAYVVSDVKPDGSPELWSLPSSWVKPDHSKEPFGSFKLVNPSKPSEDGIPLEKDQVAFAYLPTPADPLSAYAPASSQGPAIRISGHIDSSRERFFENGIFPSVVVTVGKDPIPGAEGGGIRPRLTAEQRRQVNAVIRKTMGGVANLGNPAIIDGMIESIERFSLTDNEMGWDKSDESVRAAILGAYGVHPFILGREMNVGGWSQATIIKQLFYDNVNTYLDFLGMVVTDVISGGRPDNKLIVWWQACEAVDPTMYNSQVRFGRQNNDITQDEFRGMLGLAPDEDRNQSVISKEAVASIVQLLGQVSAGAVDPPQAVAIMEGMGIPTDLAKKIAGKKKPQPPAQPPAIPGQVPPTSPAQEAEEEPVEEEEEDITPEAAVKMLKESLGELRKDSSAMARDVAGMVIDLVEEE